VVLKDFELRRKIMDETHCSRYSIHSETNKMYQDLKENFWRTRMKREMAKYVSKCDTYRRVKTDHLRPTRNLQPLSILKWKWDDICMDFIVGLPHTSCEYSSIWVIVDCLTKSVHFIPVSTAYRVRQYAELYISHIVRYHGIRRPLSPTDDLSLLLAFGSNYMNFWAPISSKAQPIILKLMDKLNSQSNHQIYASCLCSDGWSKMGQAPSNS
jgi:hypothetical protein